MCRVHAGYDGAAFILLDYLATLNSTLTPLSMKEREGSASAGTTSSPVRQQISPLAAILGWG